MEVVGDIAHVAVDPELAETLGGHLAKPGVHVTELLVGRLGTVRAPDDHRHLADVALGDPADLVLVIPGGDARGLAEIARPLGRAQAAIG
jgi:hypothetical protein